MQKLVIQDDEGKTTVVPLIKDEITVGRKEGNTIRLTERNVSRQHARIVRNNGTIEIEDLDSYNGVKVNGARIQGRIGLNPSDRIQIGDYLIELKADGSPMPGPAPEEQPTRPIPQADAPLPVSPPSPAMSGSMSGSAIQAMAPEAIEDAPTTKVPSSISFPGLTQGSAPPDPLASTDPGRPAVAAAAEAVPVETYGRLVILSDNYAGQEFELNRASMVIGRTDDNDVVVNHRSISRHHAKIVRENGRYAVIDLQSSNGVRVNGEEYGKVELRRGDVIDLGHVRLRFVEPGEDFLFGRDAQAVPIPSSGNRALMYGLLAVIIIGAIAVFAMTRGGDGDEGSAVTPDNTDESGGKNSGEGDTPDSENSSSQTGDAQTDEIAALIKAAVEASGEENWLEAKAKAAKALEKDPGNETAKKWLNHAESEQANSEHFGKFREAIDENDPHEIAKQFAAIKRDSVYHDRARPDYEKQYNRYITDREAAAKQLTNTKKCSEVANIRIAAETIWDKPAPSLAAAEAQCNRQAKASATRKDQATTEAARRAAERAAERERERQERAEVERRASSKSFDELDKEMNTLAKRGQYGAALKTCKQAFKKKSSTEVAAKCGLFACKSKRPSDAKRFYKQTDASRRNVFQKYCTETGTPFR